MKTQHKHRSLFPFPAALLLFLCLLLLPGISSHAADIPKKIRAYPGTVSTVSFDLPKYGMVIKNLKTSSKNLVVKVTGTEDAQNPYTKTSSSSATLSVYAKKAGTYKVTFDLYYRSGKKSSRKTIRVYAASDSAVKSCTFNGKPISYGFTSAKSGKIKVTMNKGYKLKKVEIGKTRVKKSGKNTSSSIVYKTIKNGQKVTLSTTPYRYGNETTSITGAYSKYYNTNLAAYTYVRVTYADKYTKLTDTVTYSLMKLVA